jgi:hypothetical protein
MEAQLMWTPATRQASPGRAPTPNHGPRPAVISRRTAYDFVRTGLQAYQGTRPAHGTQ